MSSSNQKEILLRFEGPDAPSTDNNTITVQNNQQTVILERFGPSKRMLFISPPPEENGILTFIFNQQFNTLQLYFDQEHFYLPQFNSDGELSNLTPIADNDVTTIFVFPLSPDMLPGTVSIKPLVERAEIGLVIVGTSGLSEPYNY